MKILENIFLSCFNFYKIKCIVRMLKISFILQRETETREQSNARDGKKREREDKTMKQFNNVSIYVAGEKGNEYPILDRVLWQVVIECG